MFGHVEGGDGTAGDILTVHLALIIHSALFVSRLNDTHARSMIQIFFYHKNKQTKIHQDKTNQISGWRRHRCYPGSAARAP